MRQPPAVAAVLPRSDGIFYGIGISKILSHGGSSCRRLAFLMADTVVPDSFATSQRQLLPALRRIKPGRLGSGFASSPNSIWVTIGIPRPATVRDSTHISPRRFMFPVPMAAWGLPTGRTLADAVQSPEEGISHASSQNTAALLSSPSLS